MLSTAVGKPLPIADTQDVARSPGEMVARKIWLPKMIYDVLPYFYLTSGFAAFFATLYINEWFWVLPHYLLFSAACLHLGCAVYNRRKPLEQRLNTPDSDR